jgi:hypothetical protein
MNKVLLPKKTIKGIFGPNARRLPSASASAGFAPGRPALPNTYLPRFA